MALQTTCILVFVLIGTFESEAGDDLTNKETVLGIFFFGLVNGVKVPWLSNG